AANASHRMSDAAELVPPPDGLTLLQQVSWYELTGYMRNVLLRDSDVFSMAHGLELRVPFVDALVAAASMSVADGVKLVGGRTKPLLIDAIGDRLPREVWDRPKRGFTLPFERWMRGALRSEIGDALTNRARLRQVGLDANATAAVWRSFIDGRGVSWSRPWTLYTLVRWAENARVGAVTPPASVHSLVA
ncbi:MAG: asparagine synthase-related protein, partial [Gemmatimonadaceae bacterium]